MYKARVLLQQNVSLMLRERRETQKALAFVMNVHPTTLNKFLQGTREIQLAQLDKMAEFFGLEAYQLFQPGIARFGERRKGRERRNGGDRRIGHHGRTMVRAARSGDHEAADQRAAALPEAIQTLVADFEQRIAHLTQKLGGPTPRPRPPKPDPRPRRRPARRPDAEGTE
jgi:transcriptional regulator with XRE-family HTH domain